MNIETTIEQLQPYLAEIAQGIGQASGWTWEIFVRQQYVDGFIALFFLALSLILVIFNGLLVNHIRKEKEYELTGLVVILSTLALVGIIASSVIAIQKFANPEYQALTDIISTVRGGE